MPDACGALGSVEALSTAALAETFDPIEALSIAAITASGTFCCFSAISCCVERSNVLAELLIFAMTASGPRPAPMSLTIESFVSVSAKAGETDIIVSAAASAKHVFFMDAPRRGDRAI
jgi:hypothetical protein